MSDETFVSIIGFTVVMWSLEGVWIAMMFGIVMLLIANKS